MSATPQFIVGAEGLDLYAAGVLGNKFPWFQTNATYQGQVVAGAGVFGGNGLSFAVAAANQSGMEYQFPSTMQVMKNQVAAGGKGAFGVCGWVKIGTPVATGTDILLALGSSANPAAALPLLGLNNATASGLSLVLPSTTANLVSAPHLLAINPNSALWVGVYFSYTPNANGTLTGTLCLSGSGIYQDVPITFSTDIFTAGQLCNRLRFYSGVVAPWTLDDMIIHAVSNADTLWPAPTTLNPEVIPQYLPRQISLATATGPGSKADMTPSGSEPNWQSATDQTGANSVIATAINQTDTYKWSTTATDIKAVVYRGQSEKYSQLSAVQLVGATQSTMGLTEAGPNDFIGISENDGAAQWTATSVAAAEFGQTSHN
jgi:hypothetical protein